MKPPSRIVTLTSDFGMQDGYVGALKGVILTLAPFTRLEDIAHDVPPQDIQAGAWCLRRATLRFPEGTVHLAVVDPGVGSLRAGVVVETERYFFIGPDNGLLSLAAQADGIRRVFEISETGPHWKKSQTFDGLNFFAPVAALLADGHPPEEFGNEAEELAELREPNPKAQGNVIEGEVILFDRFGNAITNITRSHLGTRKVRRIILRSDTMVPMCAYYSEMAGNKNIGALVNSDDRLELSIFAGSAQKQHHLRAGDPVRVLLEPN
ncbi:MAG: SAM-dependent chlorinase/fluorinase [Deltaproteobacteria bacterium]|nr:SAM-dependent chlorinase/fluorinase [Deltaproteobacteria bacterium]